MCASPTLPLSREFPLTPQVRRIQYILESFLKSCEALLPIGALLFLFYFM